MDYMKYMIQKASQTGYIKVVEGITRRTLVYGNSTLMAEFCLGKGRTLPVHRHPHEQTGYLVSGHIILTIDGKPHDMKPGDSWAIPGNVEHGAEVIEDSVAIEVFSPVREDYKP
ncbi:cupin domain-containing protein [Methanocella conradii]|uniref:cupin domain-containing protein n=1 Tax=Methanocella conradii TaxID=1175444 RepID=UPI0024B3600A|nr:cupin domain-containing protein [Methanocella conradii]MDI6897955.1 cupin domain-containing protein [Methanocella conradii]